EPYKYTSYLHPKLASQTIISYLSVLKHHHIMNHLDWNRTRNDPLITLKTIEDNHIFKPSQQKEHITRDQLRYIRARMNLEAPDDLLFGSVALVAFNSLTRMGELLPKSQNDVNKIPTVQALKFDRSGANTFATIQLPRTKNHRIVERPILIINSTSDELCPISALKAYTILRTRLHMPQGRKRFSLGKMEG
ncbi:17304_t:CDS:1, partial [Racocetra persica]